MEWTNTYPSLSFEERLWALLVLFFVVHMAFPQFSHGVASKGQQRATNFSHAFTIALQGVQGESIAEPRPDYRFAASQASDAPQKRARRTLWVLVTAYSSTPDQTDNAPYIGAAGTFVRDGMVAANFLPFRTRLRMPEYFGNKEFFVEDRMNKRYFERIDIWMPTREEAKQWGARWVKVEVL